MIETQKRDIWVDNVKIIACILVALGHFFQSMIKADILPNNSLYQWFNQTIYYFHVPLFFICSGYLYQKYSKIEDIRSWIRNIGKKALGLGIPYFTFSLATWLLKTAFSDEINHQIGGLLDTLFLHPTSPYWYLYALFLIFLITPTFDNKTMAIVGFSFAVVCKLLIMNGDWCEVRAISYIMSYEIWFVVGMCINVWSVDEYINKKWKPAGIAAGIGFISLSVLIFSHGIQNQWVSFAMGMLACFSVVVFVMGVYEAGRQSKLFACLAEYTMPIFLMHTLFAAPLRIILLKAGIQNGIVHVVLGIAISFIGPMIAAIIMKKSKWLEFFVYPGKFIKFR